MDGQEGLRTREREREAGGSKKCLHSEREIYFNNIKHILMLKREGRQQKREQRARERLSMFNYITRLYLCARVEEAKES